MESSLLLTIILLLSLAVLVLYICNKINVPAIVGFLITGIIAGPHGLAVVSSVHEVENISEIGVILLLFSIGLEFSFQKLLSLKKNVLLGGSVQVLLTILITFLLTWQWGMAVPKAVFIGFLVSLSSTAIVLKQLGEKADLYSPQGKVALGILLYQDIIVVPMMLVLPFLASQGTGSQPLGSMMLKALVALLAIALLARYVVPRVLYQIARAGSRELFLLSIILLCFSIAWLTSQAGLSLALGALLAGLIVAESEYSHQALANILPFLDTFTSLFFISIGMLLNVGILMNYAGQVILLTLAIIVGKMLIAGLAAVLLGYPRRTGFLVGIYLAQVGEFSFIVAQSGYDYGLIGGLMYQGFLAASILTMIMTPFLMLAGPILVSRLSFFSRFPVEDTADNVPQSNHLVIIGFGINGKNLARAAASASIPYIILEINADTVREERQSGQPILYGDATQEIVLKSVHVNKARVVVIAISDAAATRRITAIARSLNPGVHIIVRTRFVADMTDLYQLGADEVIPEEYETSVEIFARVLVRYLVPSDEIDQYIETIRSEDYRMFRSMSEDSVKIQQLGTALTNTDIATLRVGEASPLAGKKLGEIDLRGSCGLTVLAIRRNQDIISNPGAADCILPGDALIVMGPSEWILQGARMVTGAE